MRKTTDTTIPKQRHVDYEDHLRRAWARIDTENKGSVRRKQLLTYLPWMQRTNPDLVRHIQAADVKEEVDWQHFYELCTYKRKIQDKEKQSILEVCDVIVESLPNAETPDLNADFTASLLLRDGAEGPRLKSEIGTGTDGMIHHQAQRVEWRIQNIKKKCFRAEPGKALGSRVFSAAGVPQMSMRFWPAGYLTSIQKRQKYMYTFKVVSGWACLGLTAPIGTALRLQFFIGSQQSPVTNIYFDEKSMHMTQLWEPPILETPYFSEDEELVVGCDIFENLSYKRFSKHSEGRLTTLGQGLLTRSLTCLSASPWIEKEEEKRASTAYKEMALTGMGWTREKRYHPHATNILTSSSVHIDTKTKEKSAARQAILKEVESLPWAEPDEPDTP
jgi:hypothetical protein